MAAATTNERRTSLFRLPRRSIDLTDDDYIPPSALPTNVAAPSFKNPPVKPNKKLASKKAAAAAAAAEAANGDGLDDSDEETVPQSSNANIATKIQLTVRMPPKRRVEVIRLSPYCIVQDAIALLMREHNLPGIPSDYRICRIDDPTRLAASSSSDLDLTRGSPASLRKDSSNNSSPDISASRRKGSKQSTKASSPSAVATATAAAVASTLIEDRRMSLGDGDDRFWLDPQQTFYQQHLKSGDELSLKNTKEKLTVQVVRPPNRAVYSFNHEFTTTVRAALAALLSSTPDVEVDKYGFYYAMRGIWLDGSKPLEYYDIEPQHMLELRLLSQEFLLKVRLPDAIHQNTVMLKVVKSQMVGELVNMIHSKVNVEGVNQYALYHNGRSMWLDESRTLADYDIEISAMLEYKSKFRPFTVNVVSEEEEDGKEARVRPMTVLIDHNAFLGDVIELVRDGLAVLPHATYALFDQSGEQLKPSDTADVLIAPDTGLARDPLELRAVPVTYMVTPSYDLGARVAVQVSPLRTVARILPTILRRLGVREADFDSLSTYRGVRIVPDRTLQQQGVQPTELLLLRCKGDGWEPVPADAVVEAGDEGLSIWDEPRDSDANILMDSDDPDHVASGSVNKLVERLTSDTSHDFHYIKTFLMTYQSFMTPEQLLNKLAERYNVPRPQHMSFHDFDRTYRKNIRIRVLVVLKQWAEKFSYDFVDGTTLTPFAETVLGYARDVLLQDDPKFARSFIAGIYRLREGPQRPKDYMHTEAPPPRIPSKPDPTVFDYHPLEIARQLTLMEFELLAAVKPPEFLRQAFNKATAQAKAPNILRISQRFNRIVLWVIRMILIKDNVRKRAARFAKLIEVADHLHALRNFSTLMAFVAGFNNAAIVRLKHTRAELPGKAVKRLEALEAVMSAEASYREYRQQLQNSPTSRIPYMYALH